MIAIGRVLTGKVPDDLLANDFRCYTCSLSKFLRMRGQNGFVERAVPPPPPSVPHSIPMPLSLPSPGLVTPMAAQQQQYHYHYQQQQQQQIPANLPSPLPSPSTLMRDGIMVPPGPGPGPMAVDWHAGIGVRSVWDCITNADCSFLSGGEERGWYVACVVLLFSFLFFIMVRGKGFARLTAQNSLLTCMRIGDLQPTNHSDTILPTTTETVTMSTLPPSCAGHGTAPRFSNPFAHT